MLILASRSAARNALLAGTGLRFETSPAQIDERALEADVLGKAGGAPDVARRLAAAKALTVASTHCEALVIGADQVLAVPGEGDDPSGGEILHKPADLGEAARQLDRLRGRTHHLHSGLALARGGDVLWSAVETAKLTMRTFSGAERDAVLALEGPEVLGSVGGYRLEGPSIRLFERIEGDYFTVLGLPLLPLLGALRHHAPELLPE